MLHYPVLQFAWYCICVHWLVVWNMFFHFPIYWESHHPNWLIFFRGVQTTNQYVYVSETGKYFPHEGLSRMMIHWWKGILPSFKLMNLHLHLANLESIQLITRDGLNPELTSEILWMLFLTFQCKPGDCSSSSFELSMIFIDIDDLLKECMNQLSIAALIIRVYPSNERVCLGKQYWLISKNVAVPSPNVVWWDWIGQIDAWLWDRRQSRQSNRVQWNITWSSRCITAVVSGNLVCLWIFLGCNQPRYAWTLEVCPYIKKNKIYNMYCLAD